jgi:hypothetical protein
MPSQVRFLAGKIDIRLTDIGGYTTAHNIIGQELFYNIYGGSQNPIKSMAELYIFLK